MHLRVFFANTTASVASYSTRCHSFVPSSRNARSRACQRESNQGRTAPSCRWRVIDQFGTSRPATLLSSVTMTRHLHEGAVLPWLDSRWQARDLAFLLDGTKEWQ